MKFLFMLYNLHESGHKIPLMIIEADGIEAAWEKAYSVGIQNKSDFLTIDEMVM